MADCKKSGVVSPFGETRAIDALSHEMTSLKKKGELQGYSFFFNGGPEMTVSQYAQDISQMLNAYKAGRCTDETEAVLAGKI